MTGNIEKIQQQYNVNAFAGWAEVKQALDVAGFGIGELVTDRQGDTYKITRRDPKSYKFGESTRTFRVSFLGVKLLKATGTFGQYAHCIIF